MTRFCVVVLLIVAMHIGQCHAQQDVALKNLKRVGVKILANNEYMVAKSKVFNARAIVVSFSDIPASDTMQLWRDLAGKLPFVTEAIPWVTGRITIESASGSVDRPVLYTTSPIKEHFPIKWNYGHFLTPAEDSQRGAVLVAGNDASAELSDVKHGATLQIQESKGTVASEHKVVGFLEPRGHLFAMAFIEAGIELTEDSFIAPVTTLVDANPDVPLSGVVLICNFHRFSDAYIDVILAQAGEFRDKCSCYSLIQESEAIKRADQLDSLGLIDLTSATITSEVLDDLEQLKPIPRLVVESKQVDQSFCEAIADSQPQLLYIQGEKPAPELIKSLQAHLPVCRIITE